MFKIMFNTKGFIVIIACLVVFGGLGYLFYGHVNRPDPNTSSAAAQSSIGFANVASMDATSPGAYGTFQSNSQKVVQNQYGIFVSYLKWVDESVPQESRNVWAISRSHDNGATFTEMYHENAGSRAPALETDSNGNVYALGGDWAGSGAGILYIFRPSNFSSPSKTVVPNMACCKYTLAIDESRGELYAFRWGGYFSVLGLDGTIKNSYQLVANSDHTNVQYPNLYVDNGVLYAAWTTQRLDQNLYWSIHFMLSKDGGATWQKPNGAALDLPVLSDESGPTDRITLDDEFSVNTYLAAFLVKNGKAHFMYQAQKPTATENYVRYDLASGQIDSRITPNFGGETFSFNYLDGFCTSGSSTVNIYCVSRNADDKIAIIYTSDNGGTWHDWAKSTEANKAAYSISGGFRLSTDGYIIGAYTQTGVKPAVVQFFKSSIIAGSTMPLENKAAAPVISNTLNSDGTQSVAITSATPGVVIYYTIDGSEPNFNSLQYGNGFKIDKSTTIKALANISGTPKSDITVKTITFAERVAAPTITSNNPNGKEQIITITPVNNDGVIYYTIDGSEPNFNSLQYQKPFTITKTTTVKALFNKTGVPASSVVTGVFTVGDDPVSENLNLSISANPVTVESGKSSVITWVCKDSPAVCNIFKDGVLIWSGSPGQSSFSTGPLNATTTYTLSTVNKSISATVSVLGSRDAVSAPVISQPTPNSKFGGSNVLFTWSNVGAESYKLIIYQNNAANYGGQGKEILRYEGLKGNSFAASGLPTDGSALRVEIVGVFASGESANNYSYIAASNLSGVLPGGLTIGSSFKYINSPAVYYVNKKQCKELYTSWKMFLAWGSLASNIRTINESDQLSSCGFVRPPGNSVLKVSGSPTIYLFDGLNLRPFATWSAFTSLGFTLANIIPVSQDELGQYQIGAIIK